VGGVHKATDTFTREQRPTYYPTVVDHGGTNRSCELRAGSQRENTEGKR